MTFARIRALAIVGVLVVAALAFVVVAIAKDRQTHNRTAEGCPKGAVPVSLKLYEPKDIKLNVYNATDTKGLAQQVANDFKARKFNVDPEKASNDPLGKRVDGVAVLRYGPKTVGAAWVVRSYLLNDATLEFDPKRADDSVDVVLGGQFRQLGSFSDVNMALAQAGSAKLPEGACDGGSR